MTAEALTTEQLIAVHLRIRFGVLPCSIDQLSQHLRDEWLREARDLLALIESAQSDAREKMAAWMMRNSIATGHGDTLSDLISQLPERLNFAGITQTEIARAIDPKAFERGSGEDRFERFATRQPAAMAAAYRVIERAQGKDGGAEGQLEKDAARFKRIRAMLTNEYDTMDGNQRADFRNWIWHCECECRVIDAPSPPQVVPQAGGERGCGKCGIRSADTSWGGCTADGCPIALMGISAGKATS